jgi:hypothetical protein
LAAAKLASVGRLALQIGMGSTLDDDVERNSRYAVALVRRGRSIVTDPSPLLHAVAAWRCLTMPPAPRPPPTRPAVHSIGSSPKQEPSTVAFWGDYTEAVLFAEIGQGLRDAGRHSAL